MLRIAVCDDNPAAVDTINDLLCDIKPKYGSKFHIDMFLTGESFIVSIENNITYDIVYMDIELGGQNGIDIGRMIRKQSSETMIVFISLHDKYYKPAFGVQPFDFMDKPIDKIEFVTLFERMYKKIFSNDNLFQYSINKIDKRVAYKDILYFESIKRYITICTKFGQDGFYGSITKLARDLKRKEFIMLHQSFVANYAYIVAFDFKSVKLTNGMVIMIPVNRRKIVRAEYLEMKQRGFDVND